MSLKDLEKRVKIPISRHTGKPVKIQFRSNSTWTNEEVLRLIELWWERVYPVKMAKILNDEYGKNLSRSAVIGKLARLGLRTTPNEMTKQERHNRQGFDKKRKRAKKKDEEAPSLWPINRPEPPQINPDKFVPTDAEVDVPVDQRKTLIELEDRDCRWPIGDPKDPDFHFCAARTAPMQTYCAYHMVKAGYSCDKSVPPPYPLQGQTDDDTEKESVEELEPA